MALVVKNLSASLGDARDMDLNPGLKDPLEEQMASHSSIFAWEIQIGRASCRERVLTTV